MIINRQKKDDITVVCLTGKITLYEGHDDVEALTNDLLVKQDLTVALNLQAVPYIDAAGLGDIVRMLIALTHAGGKLALVSPSDPILNLFEITKLRSCFDIFDSEDAARVALLSH